MANICMFKKSKMVDIILKLLLVMNMNHHCAKIREEQEEQEEKEEKELSSIRWCDYNTLQCSTVQWSKVQYIIEQYNTE